VWLVPAPGSVQRVPPKHGWREPPPPPSEDENEGIGEEDGNCSNIGRRGKGERAESVARAAAECEPWSAAVYGEAYANVVIPGLCATPIDPIVDDDNKEEDDAKMSSCCDDGEKMKNKESGKGCSTMLKKRGNELLNDAEDCESSSSATTTSTAAAAADALAAAAAAADALAAAAAAKNLPPALGSLPMLKLPFAAARAWPSSLEGVASGARSAVVRKSKNALIGPFKESFIYLALLGMHVHCLVLLYVMTTQVRVKGSGGGIWYRLKGCGNHAQVSASINIVVHQQLLCFYCWKW